MTENTLSVSDYAEPVCPFCTPEHKETIPLNRVLERLDRYLNADDEEGAFRHLHYWLKEAETLSDGRGILAVLNELVGLNRKTGREEALGYADRALALAEALGLSDSVTMGTTLINAATAKKAFGKSEEAIPLFLRAKELYERLLPGNDARLGGLLNNMALAYTDLGEYSAARGCYDKALAVMEAVPVSQPERAITELNLADLTVAERGEASLEEEETEKEIDDYLKKARELLDAEGQERDGNYAYVCEKCAPVFGHYGWFLYERELYERARTVKKLL